MDWFCSDPNLDEHNDTGQEYIVYQDHFNLIIGKASFINLHQYLSFVELANEFNLLFVFMYIVSLCLG